MNGIRTLRDCWLGFWHGATRPSLASLVITFSVNVLAFVALCVYITPDFLAGPMHRYLMKDPFDSFVPVTAKAFYSRYSKSPQIVIFGDSLTVRCIVGEDRLADMVAEKLGRPAPTVYDLSADGEAAWDMLALVEQLPLSSEPVLILGVGPGLLSGGIEVLAETIVNMRIGISSETLDNEARSAGLKVPYRTGIYFIDHWRFFLPRLRFIVRNLLITGAQPYGDPFDIPWMQTVNRPEFWQQEISEFPSLMLQYDTNRQANLKVIERIVSQLKARGNASFILLEAPINPRWYNESNGKEFFERYHNDLRQFATEHGMSFLSASEAAALLPTDFVDYEGHIGTHEARERCMQAIASRVAKIMTKKEVSLQLSESANTSKQ